MSTTALWTQDLPNRESGVRPGQQVNPRRRATVPRRWDTYARAGTSTSAGALVFPP